MSSASCGRRRWIDVQTMAAPISATIWAAADSSGRPARPSEIDQSSRNRPRPYETRVKKTKAAAPPTDSKAPTQTRMRNSERAGQPQRRRILGLGPAFVDGLAERG